MSNSLLAQLTRYQSQLLTFVQHDGADNYHHQFHPDLSPSGWHLGHCVFTENYWIREVIEGQALDDDLRALYVPEFAHKPGRGARLPGFSDLVAWASDQQRDNKRRFARLLHSRDKHPLLRAGYLGAFLVQHYAQHHETLCQVRAQRQLQTAPPHRVRQPLKSGDCFNAPTVTLAAGNYTVGQTRSHRPYDNEYPAHQRYLAGCHLARAPASNADYLAFMQDGGYQERRYWAAEGWAWLQQAAVDHPCYWCRDEAGQWYGIGPDGPFRLKPTAAVSGLNYHEARAFATWAGGRLPHEHEWEAAARQGLLNGRGQVWEWCDNTFYPYDGFEAYPYDGYSLPYFDGDHYVLKGGSRHTCRVIKRPSFRNYYEADKRHIFAGVRPVFD